MTINEHIDSWDNERLMRISYTNDGKIEVKKTHGMSYLNVIKMYCNMNGYSLEQYYQTLELRREYNDNNKIM